MRDDELRQALLAANPWWQTVSTGVDPTAWANDHPLLLDRARYDLGYRADVLADLGVGPIRDALMILTGPRRVGKSVALLELARTLCGRADIDPRQVIHLPCDELDSHDLRRALKLGRDLTRGVDRDGPRRRVWLLDEITGIRGWTATLKFARDNSPFGSETVVVSGSRWNSDEDVEGNLLAGRAGSAGLRRVRLLLPMSFRAFIAATRPELARIGPIHPAQLQSSDSRALVESAIFSVDDYDLSWQEYLSCGGFPRAVAEQYRQGVVSSDYARDLATWLRRAVDPDAKTESLPRLLAALTQRASSPLNVRATAEELGYSRAPFDLRLNRLVSGFGALWCVQRDDHGAPTPGSQAKLYLTDPLLAWLPSLLHSGLPAPDMTVLSEMAIGMALARSIDTLEEGRLVAGDTIGYCRTGNGGEVDFAPVPVPTRAAPQQTVPIESKWVDRGWRSEAKTIEGKYGSGIVATKSILDLDQPSWAVPAPLVALLLC